MVEIIIKEDDMVCGRILAARVGNQIKAAVLSPGRVPGRLTIDYHAFTQTEGINMPSERDYALELFQEVLCPVKCP